jgi:hypothetical protein
MKTLCTCAGGANIQKKGNLLKRKYIIRGAGKILNSFLPPTAQVQFVIKTKIG